MPRLLYPWETELVPIVQDCAWAPESGKMGMENPDPTGI